MRAINDKLQDALKSLRVSLGLQDILTDGRNRIWAMGAPRTLRRMLNGRELWSWLAACSKHGDTVNSYASNADHWGGWELAVNYGLGCRGLRDDWNVYPVPASTVPVQAWSVRKQKWLQGAPRPRFRFCEQPPVPFGRPDGPVLIEVASKMPPLMLSHGISVAKLKEVRKCTGLLWPSWALSWRVPEAYGDVVFFGSTTKIMDIVKPTGRPTSSTYLVGTDMWSPTARDLALLERAIERERSADAKWWDGDVPSAEGGWGNRGLQNTLVADGVSGEHLVGTGSYWDNWEITKPITSRRQLVARYRQIFDAYVRDGAPYEYTERDAMMATSDTPYPYFELKVIGLVKVSNIPLIVFPKKIGRSVNRLLNDLEFIGTRIPVQYDGPLHEEASDVERRAFAALVTRSVLEWASDPCHTAATLGEELKSDSWQSNYLPTASWSSVSYSGYAWQRGTCGTKDPGAARAARLSAPMRRWLSDKQKNPGAWSLEPASALAALLDVDVDPDIIKWYADAEVGRFRLSAQDAKTANDLEWFKSKVAAKDEVVVLRTS